jgi:hypothetical protein
VVVFDARPSAFTQLSTVADWEALWSASGGVSSVDGPAACTTTFDVPGRNIVMAAGNAVVKGQLWRADAPVSTAIPAASAQDRIDRLVLRFNRGATSAPGVVVPTVIAGTPSGSPTLPPLVRTPTGLWDFPICFWTSQSTGGLANLIDNREQITNDPWHMVNLPGGWGSGQLGYRMLAGRSVEIGGASNLASSGSYNNITMFTLPPIYRPVVPQRLAVMCLTTATYGSNGNPPHMIVYDTGVVVLWAFPSAINGGAFYTNGSYSLDEPS